MRTLALAVLTAALLTASPAAGESSAAQPATLRLDGIGPLKLGMSRGAAVRTGWLSDRSPGCELASPRPIAYELDGPRAPAPIRGSATFSGDKLTNLSLARGVKTRTGVEPGKTTVAQMVSKFRRAGYRASSRFDATFQATFVTVRRKRRQVASGIAEKRVVDLISVPFAPLCE